MTVNAEDRIHIYATSRAHMETQLEESVELLRNRALLMKDRGILITQRAPSEFTVELHPNIPYGTTYECREW